MTLGDMYRMIGMEDQMFEAIDIGGRGMLGFLRQPNLQAVMNYAMLSEERRAP